MQVIVCWKSISLPLISDWPYYRNSTQWIGSKRPDCQSLSSLYRFPIERLELVACLDEMACFWELLISSLASITCPSWRESIRSSCCRLWVCALLSRHGLWTVAILPSTPLGKSPAGHTEEIGAVGSGRCNSVSLGFCLFSLNKFSMICVSSRFLLHDGMKTDGRPTYTVLTGVYPET